jgi:NAD(P)-dependent dehydrogenase (short-subunit alcohol dehydrogenase family)
VSTPSSSGGASPAEGTGGPELAGSVALVTGGAIGIGRAICAGLAAAGAKVVVADRSDPSATVTEVEKEGGEALGVLADVTSERELADAVRVTERSFGGVDILVNNAGIFAGLVPGPFDRLEADDWRKVFEVNVIGSFLAAKAVVGPMRRRGGGRIINIASTTAFKGTAYLLHYTSSKGAVLAMTKALARELGGDGIRVNAVAPGFTVSEGVRQNAEHVEAMRQNAPGSRILRREMVPDDIVGAVRFLAGPLSGFMTGQTIVVDGGAYLH